MTSPSLITIDIWNRSLTCLPRARHPAQLPACFGAGVGASVGVDVSVAVCVSPVGGTDGVPIDTFPVRWLLLPCLVITRLRPRPGTVPLGKGSPTPRGPAAGARAPRPQLTGWSGRVERKGSLSAPLLQRNDSRLCLQLSPRDNSRCLGRSE